MGALLKIRAAGFDVSLRGDGLAIVPASALTIHQKEFLSLHKASIIGELKAERGGLSMEDEQTIHDLMAVIGETEQEVIEEIVDNCRRDPEALEFWLNYQIVGDISSLCEISETPPHERRG